MGLFLVSANLACAQEGRPWWSGDWYVSAGLEGFVGPEFSGSSHSKLQFSPLISVGRQGPGPRFSSRNDNASFALLENEAFRAGLVGKLITKRDDDTSSELVGLATVPWGVEIGGFAEVYPTDWLRARGELRQGIRSHDGLVADVAVDAFTDLAPNLRLSGGPRATFATQGYYDAYYAVSAKQSAASGLSEYDPGSGIDSYGVGAALTWQATENLTAGSFIEYRRLAGPAADSSLVEERGSKNQLTIGLSANYKFNFSMQ
ncbi:MipA/OmpV family protein [Rhizobiaceae bacterium n13]|uniref:MipA/OmpV family protein n=1 Tax=Ferirhizobium litorale TaxID=2927786 RepID=A0AAE3QCW6_9HYPH|nr:MipA/OmpV family protein [Fererhizobium litorale]MDI7861484.1 MipA/OmpV family protein [Fererhizobium litorale]MDI7921630.1 MipA/OmpV family protein [Fererhizobium litorale]